MRYRDVLEIDDMSYKCTIITPSCCDCTKRKYRSCNEFEWIYVFDGVNDSNKKLMEDNPDNIYLEENHGAGYARNVGLVAAHGDYIYFQDSDDDFVGYDVLNKLYEEAKKHDADICGGSFAIIREDGEIWTDNRLDKEYSFSEDGWVDYREYQFDYGFMRFIYKTSFLKENHIYFPGYRRYQDPPFMVEAFQKAGRFYAIKDITYRINAHEKLNWSDSELDGLEAGLIENINRSLEYDYPELGRNNIRRIFSDFGKLWFKYNRTHSALLKHIYRNNLLQCILFPRRDYNSVFSDSDHELFYRTCENGSNPLISNDNNIALHAGNRIGFDSYFNSFSCGKWKMYSNVCSVGLVLDLKGQATVSLFYDHIMDGQTYRDQLSSHYVDAPERRFLYIDFGDVRDDGAFSFDIQSHSDVTIYGGFYIDNYPNKDSNVSVALAITSYHKESYLRNNLRRIEDINDDRIHVYVADNGNSVEDLMWLSTYLFKNLNTGGAGGFARGMMEISNDLKERGYTHFILMDDDIDIEPFVLERLMSFLARLKDEYKDSFVGGSMLRRDKEYFLVETGAKREGLTVRGNGYGLDMRDPNACLINDSFEDADYNAWWFCCIPVSYLRDDNYPLPLFFQWDDIDYGIRNKARVITMNGICVWHDCFDSKRSAQYIYYSTRNPLIVDACHEGRVSKRYYLKILKKSVTDQIYMYRYHEAEALLRGVEDFLRGPDWLCELDQDEHNKEILKLNEKLEPCDADMDRYHLCIGIEDCDLLHRIVRILTFNGMLLKADRKIIIPLYAHRPVQTYRASEVLYYDEVTGRGYTAKKNTKKAIDCYIKYRKIRKMVACNYDKAGEEYRAKYPYMTSRAMWAKILKANISH